MRMPGLQGVNLSEKSKCLLKKPRSSAIDEEIVQKEINRLRKKPLFACSDASTKLAWDKSHSLYWLYTTRLKSCPVTRRSKSSFSAACEAPLTL